MVVCHGMLQPASQVDVEALNLLKVWTKFANTTGSVQQTRARSLRQPLSR